MKTRLFAMNPTFALILGLIQLCLIQGALGNLPPRFTSDLSPPIVPEDASLGTVVLTLAATDPEGGSLKYGLEGTDKLRVDPFSGVVTVIKNLDREDKDTLRLVVTVEDQVQGADNNVVRVPLDLVVLDVNDNQPIFSRKSFNVEAPEDARVGTIVLQGILLSDMDQVGEVLSVTCQAENSAPCEEFEVIPEQMNSRQFRGSLMLKQPLSYLKQSVYNLALSASDGKNVVSVPLTVRVKDVQNTPPKFTGSTTGIVPEDAPIGTLVMVLKAQDGDVGDQRVVMYEIIQNPLEFFLLDAESGELRTAKPLDREAISDPAGIVHLVVKAYETESGIRARQSSSESTIQVSVTIQDVNDEAPTFNKEEFRVTIPENLPLGTPVADLDMVVQDTDVGSNSVFSLRLADTSGKFSIEPEAATGSTSLSLRVKKDGLDYENPNERKFILLVVAEETNTSPRLSSTATIHVSVADTNDNPPSFPQKAYTAFVSETATEGTIVTEVSATDRDTGIFGTEGIKYSLFGNGAERFVVDPMTGIITVAPCETPGKGNCLDYEARPTYYLNVEAKDNNGDGHTTVVPVRISLKDVNDNPPKFSRDNYKAVIQEGASDFDPRLVVKASDPDKSSRITYSIVGGNSDGLFVIDDQNGRIKVKDTTGLDVSHMKLHEIILTVEASDGRGSHSAKVRVLVQDVNNNRPIFTEESYSASAQENAQIGTKIEQLVATDADRGDNAVVSYRIMKGSYDDFKIDQNSGIVTVARKLDFDARNFYSIETVAVDNGIPQLTSSTMLNVSIIDNNDKNPYFVPTTQRVMVNENAVPGIQVHKLTAVDHDVPDKSSLSFSAVEISSAIDKEGTPLDEIERKSLLDILRVSPSGEVTLNTPLNRNITSEMTLSVTVTDSTANPPQVGRGYLVVTIVDINDHPPSFPPPWQPQNPYLEATITEELPVGSVVTTLVATDVDSNIESYEFVPPSDVLSVDRVSGVVSVSGRLDYETEDTIFQTVIVRDTGEPQLTATATLVVKLININDEEPQFREPLYRGEIKEHSQPGTEVLVVSATDKDKDHLGAVTYSLAGDHSQYFTIDSNGRIAIAPGADLDRESISELSIRTVATDSGPEDTRKQTSVPVYIKILDINDHSPRFLQKMFKASILENLPLRPPVPILQTKAEDEDVGINGALVYKITGGTGREAFRIDPHTGILYPAKRLMASEREKKYTLELEVRDMNGTGAADDTAMVQITVLPQNENKPAFVSPSHPKFKVQIPENGTDAEIDVITVSATDRDSGLNGVVRYHLKIDDQNVQETSEFRLDPQSGALKTKKVLDREEKASYELVLVAKDQGSPISYETLRVITVEVQDIDDNLPLFPMDSNQRRYTFSILENLPKDTHIGQVQAHDADVGKNSRVFYYIISGNTNSNFAIDKSNGNIFSKRFLDREEKKSYNLKVKATNDPNFNPDDKKNHDPDQEDVSVAYVDIIVDDVNDTPPKFSRAMFYAGVPHGAEVARLVRLVKAEDNDEGRNGTVAYSIRSSIFYRPGESKPVGSIVPSPFNITSEGKLLTATLMSPYRNHRFLLEIQAKEEAPPYRTDTCQVNIWVWERDELIKVVLAQRPDEVVEATEPIAMELSTVLKGTAVIDEIRYYTFDNNSVSRDWTEMLIHVVNKSSHVVPTAEVLKMVDRAYPELVKAEATSQIRKIYPAVLTEAEEEVDARMAGLIALVIALFIGFISFIAVCCCLRFWVMSPAKSREHLIHRSIDDDLGLNTTENPLWLDQKLKTYEEQELTMQVMSEFDPSGVSGAIINGSTRNNIMDAQSNTYATIQKSHGGTIRSMQLKNLQQGAAILMLEDEIAGEINDYATLDHLRRPHGSAMLRQGPRVPGVETPLSAVFAHERETPEMQELATAFTGSTFQPPDLSMANRPLPDEPDKQSGSAFNEDNNLGEPSTPRAQNLILNSNGEPCLVAELI